VARLANRAPCLWGHQEAACGAGVTEFALIVDDGATAGFMPATGVVFAHRISSISLICRYHKGNPLAPIGGRDQQIISKNSQQISAN